LVRRETPSKLIGDCAGRALTLIGTKGVDTHSSGLARTVLALINVHTLVIREDIPWLTLALSYMASGGASATATVDSAAGVNAAVVGDLTHLISSTVCVFFTLNFGAALGRTGVAHMLVKTFAESLVFLNLTVGIGTTS
jgi:hypothetical protein